MRTSIRLALSLVALFAVACGDDPVSPGDGLVGEWDLVGFVDGGVEATVTGTATFRSDGTFTMVGTVSFPGEPSEAVAISGTYEVSGDVATLVIAGEASDWNLSFPSADRAVLTELEPPPANRISLERK